MKKIVLIVIIAILTFFLYPPNINDDFQHMNEMRCYQEKALDCIERGDIIRAHDILSKSISESYKYERKRYDGTIYFGW